MRTSISQHNELIRTHASHIWPHHPDANFRPLLNLREFSALLQIFASNDDSDTSSSTFKGKKRTAGLSSSRLRTSKRIKMQEGFVKRNASQTSDEYKDVDDFIWSDSSYPHVSRFTADEAISPEHAEIVPIFQHVFQIQYACQQVAEAVGDEFRLPWESEEKNLHEILDCLRTSSSESQALNLGEVHFAEYQGRLVVVSPSLRDRASEDTWLALLPLSVEPFDLSWHGMTSNVEDMMMACFVLQSAGRTTIKAHLEITILPQNDDKQDLPFQLRIVANVSLILSCVYDPYPNPRGNKQKRLPDIGEAQRRVLGTIYPPGVSTPESFGGVINIPFFYSVLCPAPSMLPSSALEAIQPMELLPTLLPFQQRSVAWLLDREGKTITPHGDIISKTESIDFTFWDEINEGNYTWYLNRLSGALSPTLPQSPPVLGGILAEEPGLGKTLEIIALILLNPAPDRNPTITKWDPELLLEVKAIKSTLIVTPPSLASQWADELATHAPSLKVLMYEGWIKLKVPVTQRQVEAERIRLKEVKAKQAEKLKKQSKKKGKRKGKNDEDNWEDIGMGNALNEDDDIEVLDWCSYVNTFDVVITTYSVLKVDLNVARGVPDRLRREDVFYNTERARSPLVLCEWHRVVMDEVQMVGGGKTEDMVSLIPRTSSFAVSGTPARAQVADLMHVLEFLRVDSVVDYPRLWTRMITTSYGAAYFASLFQTYAIRTMKAHVKDELTIPQQTRFLVNISLGPVEKHVYDQALEAALQDLGLDARGVAASQGWQVDGVLLRSSLRRLRGICTHPQVGQLQRPGDRFYKPGTVKTIDGVLQNMRDQNYRSMMDDIKSKIHVLIRTAQLQQRDDSDPTRYQKALKTLLDAENEARALTEEVTSALAYDSENTHLKKATSSMSIEDNEKGKERHVSEVLPEAEESDAAESSPSPASDEHGKKRGALQNRLRECRLTLHRAKFLQGDLYHILGASYSSSEDSAYAAAEDIRRDLLKGTEKDAKRAMSQLEQDATKKNVSLDVLLLDTPLLDHSEILSLMEKYKPTKEERKLKPLPQKVGLYDRAAGSLKLMKEADKIIDSVLNDQANLLWEWRTKIIALLTQKLSPGEDEADGQEYQRTLDDQGEAETYLQSYTALLADRRQALVNERNLLAAHDIQEKKLRHTKAAIKAAAAADAQLEIPEDVEFQPEHEVLHVQLSTNRKDLLLCLNGRAIKSIVIELNNTAARITKDNDPEKLLLKVAVDKLRQLVSGQGAILDKFDADLTLIRKAFNQRILYFRQLQEISDSVTEVTWETTIVDALTECSAERNELEAKINTTRARQRYLEHLAKNKDEGIASEDDECCILCRCDFTRGFITQCAHVFCEGCMKAWFLRKEGKTCPVCRVPIDPDTVQRFSVNQPEEPSPPRLVPSTEPVPKSRRKITYNMIDPRLLKDIQSTGSFGDFGTKIQTLVCHILYLQMTDPGAKSIIFSAWADSLHIMERALKDNGIRCLRIDQKSKGEHAAKCFKNDPEILVLLLHGERENAGLNVTCASRVFLLESVVHHAFEVQAIARIDRMGQTRPTEVYCYYAEDTVERNILDLAARQGLSLYTQENSAGTLNISSLGVDAEKKTVDSPAKKMQKGDFIFKIDDMLAILFPHMYEDVEYLLPAEDSPMRDGEFIVDEDKVKTSSGSRELNAVAGPSRLH